jgi:3-oxoacyl-[acyl-carrier protein] reductase
MRNLEGKKAVVTGGSRGIGAASAAALAASGAQVLLTWRQSQSAAEKVVEKIRAAGGQAGCAQLEATSPSSVAELAARARSELGRVDVLFNNAGDLVRRTMLDRLTPELVREILDVNVLSTVLVTQSLLPFIPSGGVIINMASVAARSGGGPGASVYGAAKAAVLGLTRGWAIELGPRGIRVFAVAPGIIETDFHRRHSTPEFLQQAARASRVGKNGTPEDVARAVVYLAGEGGGFMTGVTIDISGGLVFP